MTYVVVLTRIRPDFPRDEQTTPETVMCRCEFEDRATALWSARTWTASQSVLAGRERVKVTTLVN